MKQWARVLGRIAVSIAAIPVAAYLVVIAINWNDRPIGPDAIRLAKFHSELPKFQDNENGYVYLMGFEADRDQDPLVLGAKKSRRHRMSLQAGRMRFCVPAVRR